jgi:hypothetical protein
MGIVPTFGSATFTFIARWSIMAAVCNAAADGYLKPSTPAVQIAGGDPRSIARRNKPPFNFRLGLLRSEMGSEPTVASTR